ncbi:MAG: pitrilysin family protein [Chloroflexota bacterium]|nr:pitrilysin family protein [Chloroflexota bacterium]
MSESARPSDRFLQTELANGLSVLVKEVHTAPVASFWIWYRVGSRNEHLGTTGISHWVEHMLFKGTSTFPKGAAEKEIARQGGVFNGASSYDFTTYFATLPTERVELSLRIEADRMVNADFDPREVEAERSVIISERQGAENSPEFLLNEELMGAALRVHPYRIPTVGHMCDLETISRTQLYDHYCTYYVPNNALAVAAGDFDADAVVRSIDEHFGGIPGGDDVPPVTAVEPPQRGERRVVVRREGFVPYLAMAFRAPTVREPDFFALTVLNAILTGASAMTFRGGGLTNKSSRLYRALVGQELAVDVSGLLLPAVDPFPYTLSAVVRPGRSPAEVEEVLEAELAAITDNGVREEEVDKAIKQAQAQFAYSSESVTGQALWLGFSEIFADHTWAESYLENLSAVTVEDVRGVAKKVFDRSGCTVGWYVPSNNDR